MTALNIGFQNEEGTIPLEVTDFEFSGDTVKFKAPWSNVIDFLVQRGCIWIEIKPEEYWHPIGRGPKYVTISWDNRPSKLYLFTSMLPEDWYKDPEGTLFEFEAERILSIEEGKEHGH